MRRERPTYPEVTRRAVELLDGIRPAARKVGVQPGAIQHWLRTGRISADYVLAVEAALRNRISRYELRPDVYGPAQ